MFLGKPVAMVLTFLTSILLHELLLIACFGMVRPWLAIFSLLQLPLLWIMRVSTMFKGHRLGNMVFWSGLLLGNCLIFVLYGSEYCANSRCG